MVRRSAEGKWCPPFVWGWRFGHGASPLAFVSPSACAGRVQTYLHIGSVQDSLRPVAQGGALRLRWGIWRRLSISCTGRRVAAPGSEYVFEIPVRLCETARRGYGGRCFTYCLFARSWRGATIGGGKADVLCSRGAGDLAMAHLRLPSCLRPRARGGYKRICILDRFKIVSVRLRGAGLQGACVEMVIALPSARAGTWRSADTFSGGASDRPRGRVRRVPPDGNSGRKRIYRKFTIGRASPAFQRGDGGRIAPE